MATPRFLRSFALAGAVALAPVLSCHAQTVKPSEVVKWDDYTFKFGPSAQMAQVFQGDKVVGSIIVMNGSLQVMPLPDAAGEKLKKSFEDWKAFNARSHSGGGAAAGGSTVLPCRLRTALSGRVRVEADDCGRVHQTAFAARPICFGRASHHRRLRLWRCSQQSKLNTLHPIPLRRDAGAS